MGGRNCCAGGSDAGAMSVEDAELPFCFIDGWFGTISVYNRERGRIPLGQRNCELKYEVIRRSGITELAY